MQSLWYSAYLKLPKSARQLCKARIERPARHMAGCNQTSDADGDGLLAGEEGAIRALDPPTPLRASNASLSTCTCEMQPWLENPVAFSGLMRRFPSDKATGAAAHGHDYQHMYYQHLPQIIRLKCRGSNEEERTLRIFEIGLGCGAGWERRSLGGSVGIWQALTPPGVKLDLHVMEFDANCARAWVKQRAGAAVMAADWRGSEFGSIGAEDSSAPVVMHTGDQNSTADLKRVFDEAGRQPFDVVIDDGSHLNEHQIGTLMFALAGTPQWVRHPGVYIVEDIQSSCRTWQANTGKAHHSAPQRVDGTRGCMVTQKGSPTIFSRLVDWQLSLLGKGGRSAMLPFPGVHQVAIYEQAAALVVS